ncbi:aminodeoxychorismate/anthranilate synthase component II [Microbispora sp. RL4-1S]|uniref:Aminodeoxychorismate/anthranilate synthase component II n=1 Tax=Microbispora oryzae TaxID=2806554 RepID=A0A940WD39_9ACTN|nr:aminodeoxychorismate/anthranilate synthase component II [Microbispora oryzae]MBP2703231.1 aminodeoxychorismate/anthranilate synthase component II [Microbispora oryzae]
MRVLIVDAFDSFVHIIRQYMHSAGADPIVVRSNELSHADVVAMDPDALVLGPGPGHPLVSGHVELVHEFGHRLPMLGVCLGHQAIGAAFGGRVVRADHLMHGKTSKVLHDGEGLFAGMPEPFEATRYHSLVVAEDSVPADLVVTARSADDGYVMGLRHRTLPIESVQFHPESICTVDGLRLFSNFVGIAARKPMTIR